MTTSDVYRIASGPVPEDLEEHLDTAHSMEHSRAALVTAMLFGAALAIVSAGAGLFLGGVDQRYIDREAVLIASALLLVPLGLYSTIQVRVQGEIEKRLYVAKRLAHGVRELHG